MTNNIFFFSIEKGVIAIHFFFFQKYNPYKYTLISNSFARVLRKIKIRICIYVKFIRVYKFKITIYMISYTIMINVSVRYNTIKI